MKLRCPRCNTLVDAPTYGAPVCPTCGFGAAVARDTAGASGSVPGAESPHYSVPVQPPRQTTDGMAVAALVLGICGILVFPLFAPIAIILGGMSLSKIKRQPELGGRGMAITGLVLGIVTVGLVIIAALVFLLVAVAVGSG